MKKMLVNATEKDEVRVALVDGHFLYDLHIESAGIEQTKSNIYKGKITKLAPSLDAAFVDYGGAKHGFLPLKEVADTYLNKQAGKFPLREGQEVLVQVCKSERGSKGAALTTFISLAGSYLVLMPNNPKAAGISRRVEGDERQALRSHMSNLHAPEGMGLIIRTAGVSRNEEELAWDLETLLRYWEAIQVATTRCHAPCLIHQEGNLLSRAIRDFLRRDIQQIIVDERETFELLKEKIALLKPEFLERIEFYDSKVPLFNHFKITAQIESAFQREVRLPSGGSIIIDATEALTAIDVNSAQSTKGGDIEETALHTNLEAAQEVARQLRLRDAAGLIVVDFIDMHASRNQQLVEAKMREATQEDRARIQLGHISKFGLLELSRQRLRPSLRESSSSHTCPRCNGIGMVRGTESLALSILRLIEASAAEEGGLKTLCVLVPLEIATYLLNEKRETLRRIESLYSSEVLIIPDSKLQPPQYQIHFLDPSEDHKLLSYQLPKLFEKVVVSDVFEPSYRKKSQMKSITCDLPPVAAISEAKLSELMQKREPKRSIFKRIWQWLTGAPSPVRGGARVAVPATEAADPMPMTSAKKNRKSANKRPKSSKESYVGVIKTPLFGVEPLEARKNTSSRLQAGNEHMAVPTASSGKRESAFSRKVSSESPKSSGAASQSAASSNLSSEASSLGARPKGVPTADPVMAPAKLKQNKVTSSATPTSQKNPRGNGASSLEGRSRGSEGSEAGAPQIGAPHHAELRTPHARAVESAFGISSDQIAVNQPPTPGAAVDLFGGKPDAIRPAPVPPSPRVAEKVASEKSRKEKKDTPSVRIEPVRCSVDQAMVESFFLRAAQVEEPSHHFSGANGSCSIEKNGRSGSANVLPLGEKMIQKFVAQRPEKGAMSQ